MRYASINSLDISNGEGTGVALFTQGCLKHCKNCFNPDTWDINGGKEFTSEIQKQFLELVDKSYISRVTFLGGEPLLGESAFGVSNLSEIIHNKYPNKKQWLYTGYTWEELQELNLLSYIKYIDIVVEGPYMDDLKDYALKFRGSKNQRIVDVQKSLTTNSLVLWKEGNY